MGKYKEGDVLKFTGDKNDLIKLGITNFEQQKTIIEKSCTVTNLNVRMDASIAQNNGVDILYNLKYDCEGLRSIRAWLPQRLLEYSNTEKTSTMNILKEGTVVKFTGDRRDLESMGITYNYKQDIVMQKPGSILGSLTGDGFYKVRYINGGFEKLDFLIKRKYLKLDIDKKPSSKRLVVKSDKETTCFVSELCDENFIGIQGVDYKVQLVKINDNEFVEVGIADNNYYKNLVKFTSYKNAFDSLLSTEQMFVFNNKKEFKEWLIK